MASALRVGIAALLCLLASAIAWAEQRPYVNVDVQRDADRYLEQLKTTANADGKPGRYWKRQGEAALTANNPREAVVTFGTWVSLEPDSADAWMALTKALLAVPPANESERYDLNVNAGSAAYSAYLRTEAANVRAEAIALLAETLKARSYWRSSLDAYKASLTMADVPAVRAAYDQLRAEQGFRILDYSVDSDAATPRLCIQFSEQLAKGQIDFAKFISVDGKDPQAVIVRDAELCVDGLSHGQRYQVSVRAGLPSIVDEDLVKTADLGIYVRDRSPQARFTGRNYVLPSKGQAGIPVVTVNTEKVLVEIFRIGDRGLARTILNGDLTGQLSGSQIAELRNSTGQQVWKGELPVKQVLNQEVTTAFPVGEAVPTLAPGVYVMSALPYGGKADDWSARATQWFIVSDLGLAALSGEDGVHGFVRSLATAEPKSDVEVRLIARDNEVLATGKTDARGYVHFAAGLSRGEGGSAPAMLVADTGQGDYAFLDMTASAFDLSDRGVGGRSAPGPLDGFVYAERGVYRPGEDVHLTALLRDRKAEAAVNLPLTLIVRRPDGVEHLRSALPDQGLGGRALTLSLNSSAMTGTWRAAIYADPDGPSIGDTSFLVEDYVPERLDLTLTPAQPAFKVGSDGVIKAEGRYLYGPPAAGLAIEGEVVVAPATAPLPGYAGFTFGLADEQVTPVRSDLTGLPLTDAEGQASVPIALPQLPRTSGLLEARMLLRLREPSGRTIERSLVQPILPSANIVGIRSLFDGNLEKGGNADFDVVVLDPEGKPASVKGLKWQFIRIERSYQWYGRNGQWNYEPVVYTSRLMDGTIDVAPDKPARVSVPVEWGSYRLEVSSADPSGPVGSIEFTAGWYGSAQVDSPDVLQVSLDKETYKAGETAKLNINTEAGGEAVVAVLRDGLLSMQQVSVPAGGTTVDLKVEDAWAPGAYVAATLYRPMDVDAKRMPSRSIGVQWLSLDPAASEIGVTLTLPDKVPSGGPLAIPVKLTGLAQGEEARLTVAAVDVGILNLTRYVAPAPEEWYFGQRQLGTEIRDLYGRLIDGMRAERGVARSGGDGGGDLGSMGSPPTQEPVALFSGIVAAGPDGTAQVSFDLPEFNGSVRVMAVAWSKTRVGHAERDVIVRDPVAMLVSGPRFLTLGDEAQLTFDLHNVEGPEGSYHLSVEASDESGDLAKPLDTDIALKPTERRLERLSVKAGRMGSTAYKVRLTGPGGIDIARAFGLEVKAPGGDVKRTTVQTLAAKSGKLTISSDVLGDMIPERTRVTVSVGTTSALDVPGLLMALDRYPYGCAEQTVSRALPLLYLNAVAAASGVTPETAAKERVQQAVDRVFEMQDSSGAFGLWGPGGDLWLSAYVSDFLTRAKEQGYTVPVRAFNQALDRLQNSVAYAADFEKGGEEIAYALYVLARNGRAPIGDLRYYADTRLANFATPMAKAQIGAALALYGDTARAERAFEQAVADIEEALGKTEESRYDYGSAMRDGAATLTLVAETGVKKSASTRLVEILSKQRLARRYTSTQEDAWTLLAAKALIEEGKTLSLEVNGTPVTGSLMRSVSAGELKTSNLVVRNLSDIPLQAVVTVAGEAASLEPAIANGIRIERSWYRLDGTPIELGKATTLAQNDRLVVVIKVAATDDLGGRALVVDRLPAGLEIENPRLVEGGTLAALPWLSATSTPEHSEFRDDRFVAAIDLATGSSEEGGEESAPAPDKVVAYVVRAVTPGTYLSPGASVEDMYRPERNARTAGGKLTVTAGK